ncbi:hypothetical protein V1280_007700 [Bradyrhizobium sp. AZCC 2230]
MPPAPKSAKAPNAATIRRWHSRLNRTEVNKSYQKGWSLYTKVSRSAGNGGGPGPNWPDPGYGRLRFSSDERAVKVV